jgi:hypothetical protein
MPDYAMPDYAMPDYAMTDYAMPDQRAPTFCGLGLLVTSRRDELLSPPPVLRREKNAWPEGLLPKLAQGLCWLGYAMPGQRARDSRRVKTKRTKGGSDPMVIGL